MNRVEAAISRSAEAFRSFVWPHLSEPLGGGDLIPVETVTESGFARALDMLAMTDAWQLVNDIGMRGLATRVQWLSPTTPIWKSWTIRCQLRSGRETEIHKLLRPGDWQRPHYIIQAYVLDDQCVAVGAIKTVDLIALLQDAGYVPEIRTNGIDGNRFHVVWWNRAMAFGADIVIYQADHPDNGQLTLI
jgi:hypothetical protein